MCEDRNTVICTYAQQWCPQKCTYAQQMVVVCTYAQSYVHMHSSITGAYMYICTAASRSTYMYIYGTCGENDWLKNGRNLFKKLTTFWSKNRSIFGRVLGPHFFARSWLAQRLEWLNIMFSKISLSVASHEMHRNP